MGLDIIYFLSCNLNFWRLVFSTNTRLTAADVPAKTACYAAIFDILRTLNMTTDATVLRHLFWCASEHARFILYILATSFCLMFWCSETSEVSALNALATLDVT